MSRPSSFFSSKAAFYCRASSLGNGQYAEYSPLPHSVAVLQMQRVVERGGWGDYFLVKKLKYCQKTLPAVSYN